MASPIEYAQLASRVYLRDRSDENQPLIPAGWSELQTVIGPLSSGFQGGVYSNGHELVISIAGTSPDSGSKNGLFDWANDILLGLGLPGSQLFDSMRLYAQVQRGDFGVENENLPISFTGHSLGGGLAGLLAGLLGKHATVFATAPFEWALNPTNVAALTNMLRKEGFPPQAALQELLQFDPISEVRSLDVALLKEREQQVINFAINGEVLDVIRHSWNTYAAPSSVQSAVDVGPSELSAIDRHSMSLHLAAMGSDDFRQASVKISSLLKWVFDATLYGQPHDARRLDLLERLIRYQFSYEGPATETNQSGMLDRFGRDMQKLAATGIVGQRAMQDALIATGIEYYNFVDVSQLSDFFRNVGGGIRFDLGAINGLTLNEQKGYARLRDYVTSTYASEFLDPSSLALDTRRQWFVQAGRAGMVAASTGDIADVMLGGAAANWLDAGGGNDLVIGGAAADMLVGGNGDDVLLGGAGKDTYCFRLGDGQDRVIDSDRNGRVLIVDGTDTRFAGGLVYRFSPSAATWSSPNGALTLSQSGSTVLHYGNGSTVDLGQSFNSGDFGIVLKTVSADPTPDKMIRGDLALLDGDASVSGIQPVLDPEIPENDLRDLNVPAPNIADTIFGRIEAGDRIESRGGDDTIYSRGGADWVNAGDGQDRIFAGSGDDVVEGDAGTDIIDGGPGNDRLYALRTAETADFLSARNVATTSDHDWLLGGGGDDILVGSAGDDALMGGDGDDLILGGAGNDSIFSDADFFATSFDWTYADEVDARGSVTRFFRDVSGNGGYTGFDTVYAGDGNDFVVGGAGDDVVYGEGGLDRLSGWGGDDMLFGGEGDDRIFGDGDELLSSGDDYLDGGAGDDVLDGGRGQDYLVGGPGNDQLAGHRGDDAFFFAIGDGVDAIEDIEGRDRVVLGSAISIAGVSAVPNGSDLVLDYGSADRITIRGGLLGRVERFEAWDGAYSLREFLNLKLTTTVALSSDSDLYSALTLYAGAGNDTLRAGAGADTLIGGHGDDTLIGNETFTTFDFESGDGSDLVRGVYGVKRFLFEDGVAPGSLRVMRVDGNDPNHVTTRDLILRYGDGEDRVGIEDSPKSVEQTYELADGTVLGHVELLESSGLSLDWRGSDENETVLGTRFGDVLRGQAGGDHLYGLDGDDQLEGGDGSDLLEGGSGADILEGGAGSDRLLGSSGDDTYVISLGSGADTVEDAEGTNVITFGAGIAPRDINLDFVNDAYGTVYLNLRYSADDTLLVAQNFGGVGTGNLTFRFSDGSQFTRQELSAFALEVPLDYVAGDDAITVAGGRFDDQILGSPQDDSLYGAEGDDVLAGGAGADVLEGGRGDDLLIGGGGDDVLRGGTGTDTFRIATGSGRDTVLETAAETSVLQIGSGIAVSDLDAIRQGVDLYLHVRGARDGVILKNYFSPLGEATQTWLLETSDGARTDLAMVLPSLTETPRPADLSAEWESFKTRVESYYRSALIGDGYVPTTDGRYVSDVTFGDAYLTTHRVSYVGLGVEMQFGEDASISTETKIVDEQFNTTATQITETKLVAPRLGAVDASYVRGGNRPRFSGDDGYGSFSYTLNGQPATSEGYAAWTYGVRTWQDPVSGEVSSIPVTLTFYPGTSAPPTKRFETIVRRHSEERNTYTINVAEIRANDLPNEIQVGGLRYMGPYGKSAWGGFNLVDAGAGDDMIGPGVPSIDPALGYTLYLPDGIAGTTPFGVPGSLLYGNDGDDTILGGTNDDLVIGGRGADRMNGGGGNDTYRLFAGDGQDFIFDDGANRPGVAREDEVVLPQGVARQNLQFAWQEAMVEGRYDETGDAATSIFAALDVSWGTSDSVRIIVPHVQQNAGHGIELFRFTDGSAMTLAEVLAIAAPATLDPQNRANVLYVGVEGEDLAGVDGDDSLIGANGYYGRLVGGAGRDTLVGGDGYDVLVGGKMLRTGVPHWMADGTYLSGIADLWDEGNVYRPGKGGSEIWATAGSDVYELDLGAGGNVVKDLRHEWDFFAYGGDHHSFIGDAGAIDPAHREALQANSDTLKLGPGIAPDDLRFAQSEADLVISFGDQGDMISFTNWFRAYENQLARIEHADGSIWLRGGDEFYLAYRAPTASAPSVVTPLADLQAAEDAPFELVIPAGTFADSNPAEVLTYAATSDNGSPLPSWIAFDAATRTFRGTPTNEDVGRIGISIIATDSTGRTASDSFVLTVLNANDAPTLARPIVDQNGMEEQPFRFILPDDTFADADPGDSLVYTATLPDGGPLPGWLAFNPATRTFSGTPATGEGGILQIEVLATDLGSKTVTDTFTLAVGFERRNLTGTAAADSLIGAAGDDVLRGLAGKDRLQGLAGDDLLDGGTGADSMAGGPGDDRYLVDNADDELIENADEGVDTVECSIGFTLPANVENLLLSGSANLRGTGNGLDNLIRGNDGRNVLSGEDGDDTLIGGGGSDTLSGNAGNDTFLVNGDEGPDRFSGGDGFDAVIGGAGDDVIRVSNFSGTNRVERIDGGEGYNFIAGTSANNRIDLSETELLGIARIEAGDGNDSVTGSANADTIVGGAGVDTLYGGGGDDTFLVNGDEGTDTFNGGEGFDAVLGGAGDDVIRVSNFSGLNTVEQIDGGAGFNFFSGTSVNNTIDLSGTELFNIARIDAGSGNDSVFGSSANDFIVGGDGADTLAGGGGNDILQGGNDNDTLSATSGRNLLDGGAGADRLFGGMGAEFLIGGKGNDTLYPGAGMDVIAFNWGDGQDVVNADATATATKTVSLGGGIRYSDLALRKSANDLVLETGNNDQLTFKDWYASSAKHSVYKLQIITEAMADYNPGASEPLLDEKVETFDFQALSGAFDGVRTTTPAISRWALMDSLLSAHLFGSDEAALGGDLAHQYGLGGTLAGIGVDAVQSVLRPITFGAETQLLQPTAVLQQDVDRLA